MDLYRMWVVASVVFAVVFIIICCFRVVLTYFTENKEI